MPLAPGTRLGPYEIVAPAGAGGMGEVYRGRDTRLDRTVAIKILPSHLSTKLQAKERFEREAKSISGLQHDRSALCSFPLSKQVAPLELISDWKAELRK